MKDQEQSPKELTAEQKEQASELLDRLHAANGKLGAHRQSAQWNPAVFAQLLAEIQAIIAALAAIFNPPKPAA